MPSVNEQFDDRCSSRNPLYWHCHVWYQIAWADEVTLHVLCLQIQGLSYCMHWLFWPFCSTISVLMIRRLVPYRKDCRSLFFESSPCVSSPSRHWSPSPWLVRLFNLLLWYLSVENCAELSCPSLSWWLGALASPTALCTTYIVCPTFARCLAPVKWWHIFQLHSRSEPLQCHVDWFWGCRCPCLHKHASVVPVSPETSLAIVYSICSWWKSAWRGPSSTFLGAPVILHLHGAVVEEQPMISHSSHQKKIIHWMGKLFDYCNF